MEKWEPWDGFDRFPFITSHHATSSIKVPRRNGIWRLFWKHFITRMHSSRMRTTRTLPYGGGFPDRPPSPGQSPPPGQSLPFNREPPGQRPLEQRRPPDRAPPGQSPPWTETPPDRDPQTDTPLNRMTHGCKNITLPQTSFAGGNKETD